MGSERLFQVKFDNPVAVFQPGSTVSGAVIMELKQKPMKARAIRINVEGRACAKWQEDTGEPAGRAVTRKVEYRCDLIYMRGKVTVWTPANYDSSSEIPIGTYRYRFKFKIPEYCAPSFEGPYGYIRYIIGVTVERTWKFDKQYKQPFTVMPRFDLNTVPTTLSPQTSVATKDVAGILRKKGRITLNCTIPRTGFVPGEKVPIVLYVNNCSSRPVVRAKAKLMLASRYTAYLDLPLYSLDPSLPNTLSISGFNMDLRKVAEIEQEAKIEANSDGIVQLELKIPPTVPSFDCCPIIAASYYVKVEIQTKGHFNNDVETSCPIIIGTVLLRRFGTCSTANESSSTSNHPSSSRSLASFHSSSSPQSPSRSGKYPELEFSLEYDNPTSSTSYSSIGTYPAAPPSYLDHFPKLRGEKMGKEAPPDPPDAPQPTPFDPNAQEDLPPTYEESVYGTSATTRDMQNTRARDCDRIHEAMRKRFKRKIFAPRYPYYRGIELDPVDEEQQPPPYRE